MDISRNNWRTVFWAVLALVLNIVFYVGVEILQTEKGKAFVVSFVGNGLGWLIVGVLLFIILLGVGGVFWIMMLVEVATKPIKDKASWIIVLLFGGFFGALVYYYCVKKKLEISSVSQISN